MKKKISYLKAFVLIGWPFMTAMSLRPRLGLWTQYNLIVTHISWHTIKKGPYSFPVFVSSKAHAQTPVSATDMRFCLKLHQGLYNMSANSKGSGETALMRRLARAFAGRLWDKYLFWYLLAHMRRELVYIHMLAFQNDRIGKQFIPRLDATEGCKIVRSRFLSLLHCSTGRVWIVAFIHFIFKRPIKYL